MRRTGLLLALAALALPSCTTSHRSEDRAQHRGAAASPGVPVGGTGHSRIDLRRGISGVRLKMRTERVRSILGPPRDVRASELHGGWKKWIYWRPRMRVTFDERGFVWDVRTYASEPRARGGTGVGSTERQVRRTLAVAACRAYGGPARYREWRVCSDTHTYLGPFTSFTLVSGRVRYVTVARGLAR